jgi:hypothetical protein
MIFIRQILGCGEFTEGIHGKMPDVDKIGVVFIHFKKNGGCGARTKLS